MHTFVFTTGLGTSTGNPLAPVIKIGTNSRLAEYMSDIIDVDAGSIIRGEATIEQAADEILESILDVAEEKGLCKTEALGQYDFIPWKRGISLRRQSVVNK